MEYQGTVKWYDPDKAFGFISGGPDGDVFVHRASLGPERDELVEGQEVLFKTRKSLKGSEAYDIVVTKESSQPPRPRKLPHRDRFDRPDRGGRVGGPGGGRRSAPPPDYSSLPKGLLTCTVVNVDQNGRFMFVRSERDDFEIFVHGSMVSESRMTFHRGDRVRVTIEQGPKGLRATSLESA